MSPFVLWLFAGIVAVLSGCASPLNSARETLKERYRLSSIYVQMPRSEGHIAVRGTFLAVPVEGVPAKKLRVVQGNKSPRAHFGDYALIEIAPDGRLTATAAEFMLPKGTPLVVLDLKVEKGVRLFTHTLVRVLLADGQAVYGCTEFVFRADPDLLAHGDVGVLQDQIDHVLRREDAA
jgi:hypothetical protein